ncbi:MAG: RNA methyltransferase [Flammeovirgaceae bacterium]|jgi:TrmH family RNA methyltransferase|nr:RNA methyltransferase [Flammeovirgaceae bacterium]
MVTKSQVKFIKSLQEKKYRKLEQCFLVEGEKSVLELLSSDFTIRFVVGTVEFFRKYASLLVHVEKFEAKEGELSSWGEFKTNYSALAVAEMKHFEISDFTATGLHVVLDDIQDPGNLGTIIRTADWYGINSIVASKETVDFYNPKVIAASKGSFCRVKVFYTELHSFLQDYYLHIPIYGASLQGENANQVKFEKPSLLLIGNEAHGINDALMRFVSMPVFIPRFGQAESLNAAIATAILLDRIMRFD